MIILENLFSMLTNGPYANTAFSGTDYILKESHYPKVCGLINMGVLEIYKRFKFLENELVLYATPNTTNYYLRPNRVATLENITENQYILETPGVDGFLNIIKVTGAYDYSGTEIRINFPRVYQPEDSVTPVIIEVATDTLRITNLTATQPISIVYQSYPNKIVADDVDPETYELNIPDTIIDPLLSYIAAKTFKPTGANDSTANADKSASYEQQYELACQKIELYGLDVQDNTERDTFVNSGWV